MASISAAESASTARSGALTMETLPPSTRTDWSKSRKVSMTERDQVVADRHVVLEERGAADALAVDEDSAASGVERKRTEPTARSSTVTRKVFLASTLTLRSNFA